MKRFTTILLALCMLLALAIPVYAEGETSGTCGDGITWEFSGSTLTISGSGKMSDFSAGSEPWAAYKNSITTVKFTGGVTYVGAYSFKDYDSITSVSLGSQMEYLGKGCFQDCDGLTRLSMPYTGKMTLGEECLRSCDNLKRIDFSGRFPKFMDNCVWDTYATFYYPADKPWPESTIRDLEERFHGRIQFVDSNGTDHVKETEPKPTQPKPKPTQAPANNPQPVETSSFATVIWTDNTTPTGTRNTRPPVTIPEDLEDDEDEGGVSGLVAVVIVVGLLAGFAAVTIYLQQQQQRKRRAARRRRRPDQNGPM